MQWHTTYQAQELVRQHQQQLHRDAEMHRLAKAARDQRRQQKLDEEQAPRSSRLARALIRSVNPAK